ncbi:MAG TPA: fibronectin type III domain-containing protein, partial [Thermoplasmata archaeon]|nr:fibronectin type III domain-containing protein [Thermoplasmata archaeon]
LPGGLSSYWLTTDAADGIVYASTTLAIVALSASTGIAEASFAMTYSASYISYGFNHLLYATDGTNDTIQVYSNAGGATTLTWAKTITLPASSNACSLSASPVAPVVADLACGLGYTTQISSSATGTTITSVTGSTAGYASVFNASGYLFVGNDTLANRTGDVLVFNPTTWTLVRTLWTAVPVDFLDFVPQLNAVMVGGFGTSLVLANATTGATLAKFGTPGFTEWPATDWSTGAIVAAGATGETLLADLVALPGVASGLAVHGGNGTLSVTWTAASAASGYPITGYTVYTSSSATGPWTSAASGPQSIENLTGLTDGTTYYVTVRATSGSGTGGLAAAVSGVPVGVPYPPTGVTIGTATTSSLVVSWGAPSATGGAAISAYTVLYATSSSGPWSTAAAGTTTTATVSGLTSGTTYFVKVEAANSAGTGNPSAPVQGKTGGSAPGSSSGGLSGGSWLWIAVAAIVVVALVVLALAMMMRRKKTGPTAPGMAPGGPGAPPPGAAGGEPPMPPPGAQ